MVLKIEENWTTSMDIAYAYHLAKRMEEYKTNSVLGYRTAGSHAEYETGEMLLREMQQIGLEQVQKDRIEVDSWEFEKAVLRCAMPDGSMREFQLGAYQTNFHTHGWQDYPMVYVGKGTAADYVGIDVTDKLVLVDINQREEWWINFPVYQAHKKGAAALIAVQEGGYGEIHSTALNAQDIAGPADAPAFSVSQKDAKILKEAMKNSGEIMVSFDAETMVQRDQISYNIVGKIPGREAEMMILLSAHYDSYFSGFQDDNAAVAMMIGIAKALLEQVRKGWKPQKTLVFAAMAAEEWGITDSKYDWSVGAYRQVFQVHPEWQGKIVADLNFELPAHAHGSLDVVRCVYEYADFLEHFLKKVEVDPRVYPDGIEVRYPIQTMSDDFSMAIAGIPSLVNDFTSGSFMETHYHSQFDNEAYYQEAVYGFHHRLYGQLVLAFDHTLIPPLDFSKLFRAMRASMDFNPDLDMLEDEDRLYHAVVRAESLSREIYEWVKCVNADYQNYLEAEDYDAAKHLSNYWKEPRKILLKIFRKAQDSFVRLNWHDEVLFPQEAVRINLQHIREALNCLKAGNIYGALEAVYGIDNNRYAFLFDREVFDYFTDYVFLQPKERLLWGAGRIMHHENLFGLVQKLKEKLHSKDKNLSEEIYILEQVEIVQTECYHADIAYMIRETETITGSLNLIKEDKWDGKPETISSGTKRF